MKHIFYFLPILVAVVVASCSSDWDDHFDDGGIKTADLEIYNGDIVSYMRSTADVSQMSQLLEQNGIYDSTFTTSDYTFIVCSNEVYNSSNANRTFAENSVSNQAVAPSGLTDGFGISTRSGKYVWVYGNGLNAQLDVAHIVKAVKTNNGYVYYVDQPIPVRQSVYEYLKSLGSDYSEFKALVEKYEQRWFDREHSSVVGVDNAGMTVYDSIWTTRSELMDRYTDQGVPTWNMRDENYVTTMFIPNNTQVTTAISNALDSIPLWLNREATQADREKFEQWIVKACFVNRRLSDSEVERTAADFTCVDGYQMVIDEQADETSYKEVTPAYWRPSVQTVNTGSRVDLSNGEAYYTTNLKIPNHIVIFRVKSRFYELWNAMTPAQQSQYFRWTNWINPMVINDCQGEFTLSPSLPTMYYHELTAEPSAEAIADSLTCSVDYDGLTYDANTDQVQEVHLPAGEYYLRMGFKHSLKYSVSIYFNDSLLVKDMGLNGQGSNFHFDRGAASEVPHYGTAGIVYPEGFDVDYWQSLDPKAIAYDTDGYIVGIVRLKQSGNFHITVSSFDNAQNYPQGSMQRNKNNIQQLMMYHWCLRPTSNNY